jgi:hypothetical protein
MVEKLNPDSRISVGFHKVLPDENHPISLAINILLEAIKSCRRARIVIHEDAIRAWGIFTPEEAIIVASRLVIDPKTGNFTDPQRSEFSKKIQEKLGLIC